MKAFHCRRDGSAPAQWLEAMFRHRHRLFVDLLGWRALARPDGRDIDAFDDARARYVIVIDDGGVYRASARLLPTEDPHMLSETFPAFVEGPVPRGPDIFEWTRHAPGDHAWPAPVNEAARLALHIGILEFALLGGITRYTAVLEAGLARRARSYGWDCTPLGPPRAYAEGEAIAVLNPVRPAHLAALRRRAGIAGPILFDGDAAVAA